MMEADQIFILSLLFLALLGYLLIRHGHANQVDVSEHDSSKKPGIPFVIRKPVYRQTTTYRRSYLQLTVRFAKLANCPNVDLPDPLVLNVENTPEGLAGIRRSTAALKEDVRDELAFAKRAALPLLDRDKWDWSSTPIENTVSVTSEVDYSNPYYINARASWFGSGSLNTMLNADGTLGSVEASVEKRIAESLTDIIPFSEILSGKIFSRPEEDQKAGAAAEMEVVFEVKEMGELATFERVSKEDPRREKEFTAIPRDFTHSTFTIRPLGATKQKEDKASTAWRFEGAIAPPESKSSP